VRQLVCERLQLLRVEWLRQPLARLLQQHGEPAFLQRNSGAKPIQFVPVRALDSADPRVQFLEAALLVRKKLLQSRRGLRCLSGIVRQPLDQGLERHGDGLVEGPLFARDQLRQPEENLRDQGRHAALQAMRTGHGRQTDADLCSIPDLRKQLVEHQRQVRGALRASAHLGRYVLVPP